MLTALDHVVIGVRALDRAADLYTTLLGRRRSWRGTHPAYGTANVLYRLENGYLELLAPNGGGPIGDRLGAWLTEHEEGIFALAFRSDDAAATARELRARGLQATEPIEGSGTDDRSGAERRWRNVMLDESETRGVFLFVIEHRSAPEALPVAEPIGDGRASISGFDHVVVQTTNPDGAADLYGRRLGLRLALDRKFPDWGSRLLFFRIAGVTVEIAAPLETAEVDASDRLWGISYRCPDVEAARRRLVESNLDVSDVRPGRKSGTRVCTVRNQTAGVPTLLISHP